MPSDSGVCYARYERYFYDSESKQCKVFNYGGCGGNANNFHSMKECETECS